MCACLICCCATRAAEPESLSGRGRHGTGPLTAIVGVVGQVDEARAVSSALNQFRAGHQWQASGQAAEALEQGPADEAGVQQNGQTGGHELRTQIDVQGQANGGKPALVTQQPQFLAAHDFGAGAFGLGQGELQPVDGRPIVGILNQVGVVTGGVDD